MFGALGFAGAFAHSIAIERALFSSAGGAAALLIGRLFGAAFECAALNL